MLDQVDFSNEKLSKSAYKQAYDPLVERLITLQQKARQNEVGMVVLFEGWNGAGKGSRISDIIYNLDARATSVSIGEDLDRETAQMFVSLEQGAIDYFPLMQQFWQDLGPRGSITFYDRGWYTKAVQYLLFDMFGEDFGKKKSAVNKKNLKRISKHAKKALQASEEFERQLKDNGYAVVKIFLHISHEEQKRRLTELRENPVTRWRVSEEKLGRIANYNKSYELYETMLKKSNFDFAPWSLINGEDRRQANIHVAQALVDALEEALEAKEREEKKQLSDGLSPKIATLLTESPHSRSAKNEKIIRKAMKQEAQDQTALAPGKSRFKQACQTPDLERVDYSLCLERDEYRKQLKAEQERLFELELEMYLKRIPLVVMFEGWDAAGKGGAIKRVAQALDARAYKIFPSPAPSVFEKAHPHLWRYWTRLPKAGHVGIYDRSWYGRVLVERVEGFATPEQWAQSYDEINGFEQDLVNWGALLVKFWVEVSPEEQLRRFQERENDPAKQWKITDEDWRNRDKYPQYKAAVEDMFRLTSTEFAPWNILESDNKYYARVKALRFINETLEQRLREG